MTRRAVAVGVFDGVHTGHRRVLEALVAAGESTVVTFDPHPVAGTPLLTSVDRRVELLREAGVAQVTVQAPEKTVELGDAILVSGPNLPVARPPEQVLQVPLVEGVSSERIRQLVAARELEAAARMLGRPFALEGAVVEGDRRGRLLGFPTANVDVPRDLLVPGHGIYVGAALGHRAAISIGVNPHFGARERRVEAYLLDFDEDLYGTRLLLELWSFVREERAFESEAALVAAIDADVAAARAATRPG